MFQLPPALPNKELISFDYAYKKRCILRGFIDAKDVDRIWIADMDCLIKLYKSYDPPYSTSELEFLQVYIPLSEGEEDSVKERRSETNQTIPQDIEGVLLIPVVKKESKEQLHEMEMEIAIQESLNQYEQDVLAQQAEIKRYYEECLAKAIK